MTRDEWHKSERFVKLRFLNNMAAGIKHKTQEFNDALELVLFEDRALSITDKFNLVKMQNDIVNMAADKLWERVRDLVEKLSPREFDDWKPPGWKPPAELPPQSGSCTNEGKTLGGFGNSNAL